jgi:hypothetical protein
MVFLWLVNIIALNFHKPLFEFRGNDFVKPRDVQWDALELYNLLHTNNKIWQNFVQSCCRNSLNMWLNCSFRFPESVYGFLWNNLVLQIIQKKVLNIVLGLSNWFTIVVVNPSWKCRGNIGWTGLFVGKSEVLIDQIAQLWSWDPRHFMEPKGSLSCSLQPPSKLAQVARLLSCILEVPITNLGEDTSLSWLWFSRGPWPGYTRIRKHHTKKKNEVRPCVCEAWCRLVPPGRAVSRRKGTKTPLSWHVILPAMNTGLSVYRS